MSQRRVVNVGRGLVGGRIPETYAGPIIYIKNPVRTSSRTTYQSTPQPRVPAGFVTEKRKVHPVYAKTRVRLPKTSLPRIPKSTVHPPKLRARKPKLSPVEKKTRAREARARVPVKGETGKNLQVATAIKRKYPTRYMDIIERANQLYHSANPEAPTNPETYELSESGFIDAAFEDMGLAHVVTVGS